MNSMRRPPARAVKPKEEAAAPHESGFVTGLVELERERLAQASAATALDDTLPDFLYDNGPAPKPRADLPHGAGRSMRRPGRA